MSDDSTQRTRDSNVRHRKSQNHAEVAEARTILVKKLMDDERKVLDARTAKLRAQRLAKEEEDRIQLSAVPDIASVPGRRRTKSVS